MKDMKKSFETAYVEHADALFRHAFFKVNNRDLAKDLLQETFTKTWSYIIKGNEIDNLKAFLYRTLNNLVIDEYRKKKSVSLEVIEEEGFQLSVDDTKQLEMKLDGEQAIKFLQKLPDNYRNVIFMRYVDELELSEIAKALNESENVISVRIHRGLKKLKEIFHYE